MTERTPQLRADRRTSRVALATPASPARSARTRVSGGTVLTPVSGHRHGSAARTVANAVVPRPVKQVSRAAYSVRHPVGPAENKAIGAVPNAAGARSQGSADGGPGCLDAPYNACARRR
jgi:hypothetical protein